MQSEGGMKMMNEVFPLGLILRERSMISVACWIYSSTVLPKKVNERLYNYSYAKSVSQRNSPSILV